MQVPACKVAVVSTYVPKNCGLATFTNALVQQLRISPGLPKVMPCLWTFLQSLLNSSLQFERMARVPQGGQSPQLMHVCPSSGETGAANLQCSARLNGDPQHIKEQCSRSCAQAEV